MFKPTPFITIPAPSPTPRRGENGVGLGARLPHLKVYYLEEQDIELVRTAAKLCGCSISDFIRQLTLNYCYTMGVSCDDRTD